MEMNMKYLTFIFAALVINSVQTIAQEDISRQNDLPNRIGGNLCANRPSGGNSTLNGSLNVSGVSSSENHLFSQWWFTEMECS